MVISQLRPLLGLGGADAARSNRDEQSEAWQQFLEALAETSPAVLIFEDLHWADPTADIVIPDTVQGILAARLDALTVDQKRLLRAAGIADSPVRYTSLFARTGMRLMFGDYRAAHGIGEAAQRGDNEAR